MTNSYIFASGAAMPCARWVFSPCGRQAERGYFHRGTSATGEGLEPTAPCRARGRRSRGRERPAGGYFHRGTSATGEGLEPTAPCRARGRRSRGRERPAGGYFHRGTSATGEGLEPT